MAKYSRTMGEEEDDYAGLLYAAPFPWFGGKSRAAELIWARLGDVPNYVEPFAGSLAVLLGRPTPAHIETVNDKDAFLCNFWRALQQHPDELARIADGPVNENDLHARHAWLVEQRPKLAARVEGDPDYCDVRLAAWWVWGICAWIGGGWCSGRGPWVRRDGLLVRDGAEGVCRTRPHLSDAGNGIHRQAVADAEGASAGTGERGLLEWMRALSERLRRVRVACGDWQRVCGPSSTVTLGITGVVLDPPYSGAERTAELYAEDSGTVAAEVCDWAVAHGDDPRLRIALCGYDGEHEPPGWTRQSWKANGGYGSQGDNRARDNAAREVVWFSPHCLPVDHRQPCFTFARTP